MAITPPANRLWWKEPIHGIELGWIVNAFLWGLFMFFFMIAWHFIGQQNLSSETYRINPDAYAEKVEVNFFGILFGALSLILTGVVILRLWLESRRAIRASAPGAVRRGTS